MLGFAMGNRDSSTPAADTKPVPESTSSTTLPQPVSVAHDEVVASRALDSVISAGVKLAEFPGVSSPSTMNPDIFTLGGSIGLDRRGELLSDQNQPSSLVLEWTAEWQHPVGQPISIPLVDITDLGIID